MTPPIAQKIEKSGLGLDTVNDETIRYHTGIRETIRYFNDTVNDTWY
jgi:hypothetical protein